MTLRKKTLLIIGLTFISLFIILCAASRIIMLAGFTKLEQKSVQQNVERVLDALSANLFALQSKAGDWANWDDTYAFIENGNTYFLKTNTQSVTFIELRINLIVFVHSSGRVIFNKAFDLQKEEEQHIPLDLKKHLSMNSPLLKHTNTESSITGIVFLAEGPMLIASRPILTSEGKGPIRGTLIFGRYLDEAEIKRLAEITHLSLTIYRFEDEQVPHDMQVARSSWLAEPRILVRPMNAQAVAGYAVLKDLYGKPALLLRADMPRDIYNQGKVSISYFILSLLGVGLVLGMVTMLLLERQVLFRLIHLSQNVELIGTSRDISARVSLAGRDELTSLAGEINKMLEALAHSEIKLRESENKFRDLSEKSLAGIYLIQDGVWKYVNPKFAEIFGYTVSELIDRKGPKDLTVTEDSVTLEENIQKCISAESKFVQYDFGGKTKHNKIIHLEAYGSQTIYRGKPAVIGTLLDITDRKQTEQAVQKAYAELERLVEERTADLRATNEVLQKEIGAREQAEKNLTLSFEKLRQVLEGTVGSLASAVGKRDPYTAGHQQRVAQLACAIAEEMNFSGEQIRGIRVIAILHDIGKLYVPAEILSKPARLTEPEFGLIKAHSQIGYEILKGIEFPWPVTQSILQHHERLNGSGYPEGLTAENILLEAKILSVADVVEAMVSHRPYRIARSLDEALEEVSQNRGILYDALVVDACLKVFNEKKFKFEN